MSELVSSIGRCSVCTLMLKRACNAALAGRSEGGNKPVGVREIKMRRILLAAALVVATALPVAAQAPRSPTGAIVRTDSGPDSVQDLYRLCKNDDSIVSCDGVLRGVFNTMNFLRSAYIGTPPIATSADTKASFWRFVVCAADPFHLTDGTLRQTFIDWATQHPEYGKSDPTFGVLTAFSEMWPCDASLHSRVTGSRKL